MEVKQITELMAAMAEYGLTDFSYEENGISLKLKKHPETKYVATTVETAVSAVPAAPALSPLALTEAQAEAPVVKGNVVKCPLVGTFYAAPSPDADAFVKVGDVVSKGQTLGIVEAMKLMNEIESEFDGVVKQILVKNGDIIEYDQPMFVIE